MPQGTPGKVLRFGRGKPLFHFGWRKHLPIRDGSIVGSFPIAARQEHFVHPKSESKYLCPHQATLVEGHENWQTLYQIWEVVEEPAPFLAKLPITLKV